MLRKSEQKRDDQGFVVVVPGSAVRERGQMVARVAGQRIILLRWEGQVYAVHSECPHAAADLAKGELHRWKLTCPEHHYCFDVRNGRLLWPEDEHYRLRTFEVKEEEGVVKVRL